MLKLNDDFIEFLKYEIAGMEDGWLEPTRELKELYKALDKYQRRIYEKYRRNSRTKRRG